MDVRVLQTDGSQPVGRGIGPALEARDVLSVLHGEATAPSDLRERALLLAGQVLELAGLAQTGRGIDAACAALDDGCALAKFLAICEARGGLREPPVARFSDVVLAPCAGIVASIDNRRLARAAKLAGAPRDPAAGIQAGSLGR
jgi:thymidine phosphorylase